MAIISYGQGTKGQLLLTAPTVNAFLRQRFENTLLPYQKAIPVFDFMELNTSRKFIRNKINTSGVFWQQHVPCKKTPQGGVSIAATSVEPCAVDFAMTICHEMWGTCFQYMDNFNSNGSITTEEFNRIFALVSEQLNNQAANELFNILFLGKFFSSQSGLTVNPNISAENASGFANQEATCTGLLSYLATNVPSCNAFDGIDYTSCESTEDILAMLKRLLCCAQDQDSQFGQIVNLGYMPGRGEASPVIIVSGNLYNRITGVYDGLQNIVSPQFAVIGKRTIPASDGSTYDMYTYRGIPIVPVGAINAWDKRYVGMQTQFVAMTVAGNIEFGSNYAGSLMSGSTEPIAFQIAPTPGIFNENSFDIKASALLDVNIVDHDLIVWDVARVDS